MLLKFSAVYSDSRALVRPTLTKCDDSCTVEQLIASKSVNINNVQEVLSGSDFSALYLMGCKCLGGIIIFDLKEQYPSKPFTLKVFVRYGQGKKLQIDNEYFFENSFFFCITVIMSVISIYNFEYIFLESSIYTVVRQGLNNGNAVHHQFVILFAWIFNPKDVPAYNLACPFCYLFAFCNLKFTGFGNCKLLGFQSKNKIFRIRIKFCGKLTFLLWRHINTIIPAGMG